MGTAFLWPRLEAAAYLVEILAAETLFLLPFEKRDRFPLRFGLGAILLVALGVATGIPAGNSLLRFLWFFLAMGAGVLVVASCWQGDFFSLTAACGAGFATQHIANKVTILVHLAPAVAGLTGQRPLLRVAVELVTFGVVYTAVYLLFGQKLRHRGSNFQLSVLSLIIVLTCIGVNRLVVDNAVGNIYFEVAACIYAILCCVFALVIQFTVSQWERAKTEQLLMERLLSDSEKQYEQWRTNVELVNVRFHDIKHMLDRIQRLAEQKHIDIPDIPAMRKTIDSFSPTARTGNDTLDVLLRNMDDLCRQNDILLHCVAYADCLKHFDGMSLYFLFANAIDNAMESAGKVADPSKRLIDISIRSFGDSASIHIWNYFAGPITFRDGLPVSQGDNEAHGFGMKSIQMMVDKFGGAMNAHTDGEVFNLDIILPVSGTAPES